MVLGASHHDLELAELDRLSAGADLLTAELVRAGRRPGFAGHRRGAGGHLQPARALRRGRPLPRRHRRRCSTPWPRPPASPPTRSAPRSRSGWGRRSPRTCSPCRRTGLDGGRRGRDLRPGGEGVQSGPGGRHGVAAPACAVPGRCPHRQEGGRHDGARRRRPVGGLGRARGRRVRHGRLVGRCPRTGHRHRRLCAGRAGRAASAGLRRSVGVFAVRSGRGVRRLAPCRPGPRERSRRRATWGRSGRVVQRQRPGECWTR